jgi:3-oxoacyl-[acyl-carrier-protein] synthase-3
MLSLFMSAIEVTIVATAMPQIVREVLDRHGFDLSDLSLLLMHQANLRINEAVQKSLGLPDEKVFNNIQRYGNTTAATLPLVFHEAKSRGRIREGDLVCFTALGAGLHWGAGLLRA